MIRRLLATALVAGALAGCADETNPSDAGPEPDAADLDAAVDIDASADETPCGPTLVCDRPLEVCVIRGPVGPGFQYACEPVPTGCELDRTCDCVAFTYCVDAFDTCSDGPDNTITCECPNCQ
jgi:hypothetical protein